ncbi:MAG TPA: hypothetical protein DDW85_01250 [Porphyromonadaceae bacterium]|nr:hypothetical protein [Porphyromonadaceae bacterium]
MKFWSLFFIVSGCLFSSLQAQSYDEWVLRSAKFLEASQLDSAEYALKSAMKTDPDNKNNASLLVSQGLIQRQLSRFGDAYISFTAALASYPDKKAVLHNRALLLCDMNRWDEAMDDYNAILSAYPDDISAYYRRGLLYLELKDRQKAEADFRKVQQIDSGHAYSQLSKALIYKLDDNWQAAEQTYTELIRSSSAPNSGYYLNRAECYVNMNQLSKASADLRAAGAEEKENPYFYILQGQVRLGQYDKLTAKEDFLRAKKLGYDPVIADEWLKKCE